MRASEHRREREVGFTLVELLVVIAIIAVLAGMLAPAFLRVREGGYATACVSNLRQLGVGLNSYLADHDLTMPELKAGRSSINDDVPVIDTVLKPYLQSPKIFACPADTHLARDTGTSFFWNVALNNQHLSDLTFLNITENQSMIPILSDKEPNHRYLESKVNILYADGHATKDLKFNAEPVSGPYTK